MKQLLEYRPFHFLICLILGISFETFISIQRSGPWELLYVLLSILMLLFLSRKVKVFMFISWSFFFFLGMYVVQLNDDRNEDSYFKNFHTLESCSILRIEKVLKSNVYSDRYYADVVQTDSIQTVGKVLLSIRTDSLQQPFQVGDQILSRSSFQKIEPPLNPHQFDYKGYLANKGIHYQVFLNRHEFHRKEAYISWFTRISDLRKRIQNSLREHNFSEDELGVINALLLGQRNEVSKELLNDYSKAGAIHILAISGLHVGIILLLLSWLLKPLELFKNGKLLKLICVVLFLWFFAILAGMSASVIRAVTMFSAVALGQFLRRKNSVVYSLVFSMFVLLLVSPRFLFDVGFQLSYLAVYGIVTIQPRIMELWKPKWMLLDKVWQLSTVSVAAQLSVLPLSLYYFHQFPGLFLLSNLVIVPFLGIILVMGILIMILSMTSFLPEFLVNIYAMIISAMNSQIKFIAHQERFLFTDISFSLLLMITCYVFIVFSFRFFVQRNIKRLALCLISCVCVQSAVFYEKFETEGKEEWILMHRNRSSIQAMRYSRTVVSDRCDDYNIRQYAIGEGLELLPSKPFGKYASYKSHQILFVDSIGAYPKNGLNSPIVVLHHAPKINLSRLIQELNPKQIVADGSNYKSMVRYWEQTCLETKTPFWSTSQNGAYILD